jgi:hypothetical protein
MLEEVYCKVCDISSPVDRVVQVQRGELWHHLCPCCGADVCPVQVEVESGEYDICEVCNGEGVLSGVDEYGHEFRPDCPHCSGTGLEWYPE